MTEENPISRGLLKAVLICGVVVLVSASVASAQTSHYFIRGEVFLTDGEVWSYLPGFTSMASSSGWTLASKSVPYGWPGWFIVSDPRAVLFHDGRTVSFWDGVVRSAWDPGKGYDDLFTDAAQLGEFMRIRSGHYLVAERWAGLPKQAAIVEFDLSGAIREYPFPPLPETDKNRSIGAEHFELLSDGCTLLYAGGDEGSEIRSHVRRMNLCTATAEPDFAVLMRGQSAGSIRELRTGEILVASGDSVLKFAPAGALIRSYVMPTARFTATVTHLALSPDGSTCYGAGIDQGAPKLYRFDPYAADARLEKFAVGNPEMQPPETATAIHSLVVVGEWRASGSGVRSRAVSRH